MQDCEVVDFTFSINNTDSTMTIMCRGKRITVNMSAQDFRGTLQEEYLHFLRVAEVYELDELTVEDFYDWVIEKLDPVLPELPVSGTPEKTTVHDFLYPECLSYRFRTGHGTAVPHSSKDEAEQPLLGVAGLPNLLEVPSIRPQSVQLLAPNAGEVPSSFPRRVFVYGIGCCFFKPLRPSDFRAAKREIETYKKIWELTTDQSIHVPRMLGIVSEQSSGLVFGLLLSYIDCGAVTLECAMHAELEPSASRRQHWAEAIQHTVSVLHEHGIVWGDVKPDNILIDAKDDPWIIDFGGGRTEGWVDKDVAETMRGDKQGLSRILEQLNA